MRCGGIMLATAAQALSSNWSKPRSRGHAAAPSISQMVIDRGSCLVGAVQRSSHRQLFASREAGSDLWGLSECYEHLGRTAHIQGDLRQAKELLETGLRMCREIEDAQGVGCVLTYLGYVSLDPADLPLASAALGEALVTLRNVGDRRMMADALDGHAGLAAAEGDLARAARLDGAIASRKEAIGCPRSAIRSSHATCATISDRVLACVHVHSAKWAAQTNFDPKNLPYCWDLSGQFLVTVAATLRSRRLLEHVGLTADYRFPTLCTGMDRPLSR